MLFNSTEFKDDELFKDGFTDIPEGDYTGKITKAEASKSAAGHNSVKLELTLSNKQKMFDRLNVEHPTAGSFAKKTLARIVKGAFKNSEAIKLSSVGEVAKFLTGVPVNITVKQKGQNEKGYMQYNIYYNPVETKLTYATTTTGTAY